MAVLGLGTLMASLDATITNVALNSLQADLHGSVQSVQWVVTAYLLALAGTIPATRWTSQHFGARRVYVAALTVFTVASGLCAVSPSLTLLVGCRVLQGAASGVLVPLSQLMAVELAGPSRAGKAMSRIWMVTSVGSILGPILGGLTIHWLGWRWLFLMNVPIGAIATVAASRLLPAATGGPDHTFDLRGLLRIGFGVPLIVFAMAQAQTAPTIASASFLVPVLAGTALVLDFVRHALRGRHPLLDVRLFARPRFAAASVALFCFNAVWFGVLMLLPLCLQQARQATPLQAGLLLAPQGAGNVVGMWIAGRLRPGRFARRTGFAGALVFAATTAALAHLLPGGPYPVICGVLVIAGFAAGFPWVSATGGGYVGLSQAEISHAAPLLAMVMRFGASFGTALAAIVLAHQLAVSSAPGALGVPGGYRTTLAVAGGACVFTAAVFALLCLADHRPHRRRAQLVRVQT